MAAEIATARRGSLLSTYGVGALFPADDMSVMICGIDSWPRGPRIIEPRLCASLRVRDLRAPSSGRPGGDVPVIRFPKWVFCTECRRLGPHLEIADRDNRCRVCKIKTISPSRFVVCCVNGHIEDFPYRAWVHEDASTQADGHTLRLVVSGSSSSLAAISVACDCGRRRSMEGAFSAQAFRGLRRCHGRRPWLGDSMDEECDQPLRTFQRGSANVWYAQTRSTISIPSPTSIIDAFVRDHCHGLSPTADPAQAAQLFDPPAGCTYEQLADSLRRYLDPAGGPDAPSADDLRAEEYDALVHGLVDPVLPPQFESVSQDLRGTGLSGVVAQLSRVSRLREVRALCGFTRVQPDPAEDADGNVVGSVAALSADEHIGWLPAIEVLGEGVFLRLDEQRLSDWEMTPFAVDRAARLRVAQQRAHGSLGSAELVTARSLLLHSLAHALLDELSLTAGYPAASLRERVYSHEGQAGILIYTATSDSAGSLGGLAALADPGNFAVVLESAVERSRWCTADPVCIESEDEGVNAMNLAACHACLLLPETSCEHFNVRLDRATLVGLGPIDRYGFFDHYPPTM